MQALGLNEEAPAIDCVYEIGSEDAAIGRKAVKRRVAIFLAVLATTSPATGETLSINCSLSATYDPNELFGEIDHVIIDTNAPRVELQISKTMTTPVPANWVFEPRIGSDTLTITKKEGALLGLAIRAGAPHAFVLNGPNLTWTFFSRNQGEVSWFKWLCRK